MGLFGNLIKLLSPGKVKKDIIPKELDYVSGLVTVEENPDRLLEDINQDSEIYDQMLLDDRIKFSIALKKRLILSVPYRVEAASDDPKDIEIKEEIEKQLQINRESSYRHALGYNFLNALDNALDAMTHGNKVGEISFRVQDGRFYLYNIKFRHTKFFDYSYDEFGDLKALVIGKNYGNEIRVDNEETIRTKFLLFVYPYPKDGNFYGESDLGPTYKLFRSKNHILKQRNIHLEKWGMPIPNVIYDVDRTSAAEKSSLKDMVDNFHNAMSFVTPGFRTKDGELVGKYKIDITEARTGTTTAHYEAAIDQLDKQITRTILIPDKLGFSESPGGSYNLGQNQFDMLLSVIKYTHHWIEERANPLVKNIVDLNFPNVEKYPRFCFDEIDHKITSEMLNALITAGVIDKREKWIRSYFGIPEISEEEKEEIDEEKKKAMDDFGVPPGPGKPGEKEGPPKPGDNPKDKGDDDKELQRLARGKNPFKADATKKFFTSREKEFERQYIDIHKDISFAIIREIEKKKIIDEKKIKEPLTIPKRNLSKFLTNQFTDIYFNGRVDAIEEINERAKRLGLIDQKGSINLQDIQEFPWLETAYVESVFAEYGELGSLGKSEREAIKRIKETSFYITGIEEERIVKAVKSLIVNGIETGIPGKNIIASVQNALTQDRARYARTIVETNISKYYNQGRMNFFRSDDIFKLIEAYQYQAILDNRTTEFCRAHNNQIIKADNPEVSLVNPPNHFNCRSILVPVMRGEGDDKGAYFQGYENRFKQWGSDVPGGAVKPAMGFGG